MPNPLEPHGEGRSSRRHFRGHVLEGDVAGVSPADQVTVVGGQLLDALLERRPAGLGRRVSLLANQRDSLEEFGAQVEAAAALAAEMVEDRIAGEGVGPGEKGTGRVVFAAVLPDDEAGLLVDVVQVDLLGEQCADERVDMALVPEHHRHEIPRIAGIRRRRGLIHDRTVQAARENQADREKPKNVINSRQAEAPTPDGRGRTPPLLR